MKIFKLLAIIATFTQLSTSLYFDRTSLANKVIELPIWRQAISGDDLQWKEIRKRARKRLLPTVLVNQPNGFYTTEITLGPPPTKEAKPQRVVLNLDTGSSNIWVTTKTTTHCTKRPDDCLQYGTYEPENSATSHTIENSEFSITYSDKSKVSGTSVTDILGIGGFYLDDMQIGIAETASSSLGVLGLGYASNELGTPTAPTLSEALLNKGLINLNAYSVWLNSINAEAGSVIYGGIDTSKYEELAILPIQQKNSVGGSPYQELIVNLNRAIYQGNQSPAIGALLDTGTEFLQLPGKFVTAVYEEMKAVPDADNNYYVPCSLIDSQATMDFEFGDEANPLIIHVPLSSLIYEPYQSQLVPTDANDKPLCSLSLTQTSPNDIAILGSPFLRSVYAVFDLTNNQVSIGQAKYTGASNVVEIPADGVGAL